MHACLTSQTPKPLPRHQAAPAYSFPRGKVAIQQQQNKEDNKQTKQKKYKKTKRWKKVQLETES